MPLPLRVWSALSNAAYARVDQLAWVVTARLPATVLQLRDRRQPAQPLVGYEVYSRPPDGEKSQFVGRTDWQGQLRIEPDPDHAVRLLFVAQRFSAPGETADRARCASPIASPPTE